MLCNQQYRLQHVTVTVYMYVPSDVESESFDCRSNSINTVYMRDRLQRLRFISIVYVYSFLTQATSRVNTNYCINTSVTRY